MNRETERREAEKKLNSSSQEYENAKKGKGDIARPLALLTQLGISMLVPIFLCLAVGIWLDRTFHTSVTIVFLILGFLAGGRNVWMLAKHEGERQARHTRKKNQYDLMAGWKEEEKDE